MKDINKKKILTALRETIDNGTFVKGTLNTYVGPDTEIKKIIARPVVIKGENMLSFTYRYNTKDVVKNHSVYDGKKMIDDMLGKSFNTFQLFTTKEDIALYIISKTKSRLKHFPPTSTEKPVLTHDKQKQRYIPADAFFLKELDISNAAGEIRTDKYDKYRQIDKFIETVDTLYEASSLKSVSPLNVYDLGSGKSYLTFALYSYFAEMKKKQIEMTGVEVRKELVDMSEKLAETCSFTGLHFQQADIAKAEIKKAHIVVALHACDTATDDAITKAIGANSQMVILAPCCHKYVRKHMNLTGALADLLREGIHIQRESDIVTDSLRALVLEYYGYKTQIFEFISSEHTSKNIMITAVKKSHEKNPEALEKIKNIKQLFGIPDFYLDKQLNLKV
jgi:hypothetical protein